MVMSMGGGGGGGGGHTKLLSSMCPIEHTSGPRAPCLQVPPSRSAASATPLLTPGHRAGGCSRPVAAAERWHTST